ncbi:hypothetical protein NOCA1200019 [metagenome]|uniref:Uncharacterized protein n=1 Tax=metagenome TaxID=256318 RepID=A0A2P2CE41_9ZZZZ
MGDKGWEGWTLRDGDVVIKVLKPYLILGDLGIRQEPHQEFQPRTVPRKHLPFFVLDAGLSVYRDGESVGHPGQRLDVLGRQVHDNRLIGGSPPMAEWRRRVL